LVVTELGVVEEDAEDAILDIGRDGISLRVRISSGTRDYRSPQYLITKFIHNDDKLGLCDGFVEVSFAILLVFLDISLKSGDKTLDITGDEIQYLTWTEIAA
jgi:hypothetical protein